MFLVLCLAPFASLLWSLLFSACIPWHLSRIMAQDSLYQKFPATTKTRPRMLKWLNCRIILAFFMGGIAATVLAIMLCNLAVGYTAQPFLYKDITQLPFREVAVVLGTSRYTADGNSNGLYHRRMEAVAKLVKAKKVRFVLVSGDKSSRWYDEPTRMKNDLIDLGVPPELIYRDYAGFRTLDSVIRAHEVFGLESFVIVSQQFQNERALYIAHNSDIDAIAFNAAGVLVAHDYTNRIREALARVLAVLEIHLLGAEPERLGPDIVIGETPPT